MPMIKIDGQDYDLDSLPDAVKNQLQSLQFVDAELARLGAQTAVFKTARIAYVNALKQLLTELPTASDNGTLKFS
ncbi:MAG: DUF6447 family protein [Rhodoferax sp.]|nr:hypothetical protein [Rhodoferax sp.]